MALSVSCNAVVCALEDAGLLSQLNNRWAGPVYAGGSRAMKKLQIRHKGCRLQMPRKVLRKRVITFALARNVSDTEAGPPAEIDTFTQSSGYIAAAALQEADEFVAYDIRRISAVFKRRPFLLLRRVIQVAWTLGSWAGARYLDSVWGRSGSMFQKRAAELRAALVRLGPAFVKIAQAVSSRPDVVPPEYLDELALLQDRIAPFSTELALDIIELELGVPIEELFSEITPQPVAAASLGQVYQARLRVDGQAVAVKVQRPGVRAAIALDIFILRTLAGYVRQAGGLNTDLQAVLDEWATSLFREMDYKLEAQNGIRFRKAFGKLPNVVIPKMLINLTSERVLIMEWVEGQRLSEVSDLHLVEVGVYCSLNQLLDSGFYHADPHPGNLLRTPDGKLAYLDFGMMGEIQQNLRDGLVEACLHLVNREFDALAGDFVNLGLLPPTNQMGEVAAALTDIFQKAVSSGVRNISFGDLSGDLGRTMYRFKFRIPAYFSLVIRSLTVLEGIALSSDPNYKVLSSSYPWIAKKVLTDDSPQLRASLRAVLYKNGVFRIDRLESLITEAMRPTRSEATSTLALVAQQENATDGNRVLIKQILGFALSKEGDFVREMLLDEVAKGIDALSRAVLDRVAGSVISALPVGVPAPSQLMEAEDIQNLGNLQRFSALLSGESTDAADGGPTQSVSVQADGDLILEEISRTLQLLPGTASKYLPLLTVLPELPFLVQQQALLVPIDLAGRLSSRVIARAIRSTIPRAVSTTET